MVREARAQDERGGRIKVLHESAYHPLARGDGGRSVGAYQTPRHRTPATIAGQTRLAARILADAARACPAHPLWAYASGRCAPSYAARGMERAVAASLAGAPALAAVAASLAGAPALERDAVPALELELAGLRLEP